LTLHLIRELHISKVHNDNDSSDSDSLGAMLAIFAHPPVVPPQAQVQQPDSESSSDDSVSLPPTRPIQQSIRQARSSRAAGAAASSLLAPTLGGAAASSSLAPMLGWAAGAVANSSLAPTLGRAAASSLLAPTLGGAAGAADLPHRLQRWAGRRHFPHWLQRWEVRLHLPWQHQEAHAINFRLCNALFGTLQRGRVFVMLAVPLLSLEFGKWQQHIHRDTLGLLGIMLAQLGSLRTHLFCSSPTVPLDYTTQYNHQC
jgi:hypothetical protein